jgi:hypothetical protein
MGYNMCKTDLYFRKKHANFKFIELLYENWRKIKVQIMRQLTVLWFSMMWKMKLETMPFLPCPENWSTRKGGQRRKLVNGGNTHKCQLLALIKKLLI